MVESLLEISESAARQQISHLPRNRRLQTLLQSSAHQIRHSFRGLQRYIAYKAVGDDHINLPVIQIPPFHISDEIQWKLLQQRKRLAGQIVALAFFLSNGKQPDAWPPRAEHAPEIDFPHHRELLKVLWLAINIGSDIEENCHRSHGRRDHCRQRSEEHTSELQSRSDLVCRLLL